MPVGKLVNVAGASFSGTTMLDLMIGNDTATFSTGEIYARFRPWRAHHFTFSCPCGANPCPVWQQLDGVGENRIHSEILRRLDVDVVVDSSKNLNWLIDSHQWARECDIEIRTVAIWKHPIQFAYSDWKRTRSFRTWRGKFRRYYGRLLKLELPLVTVKYEELVATPRETLRDVCHAIGIDYSQGRERFWEKDHHHLFGSLGTRNQCRSGESTIRSTVEFDPEFANHVNSLRSRLETDSEIAALTRALEERDVADHASVERIDWDCPPNPHPPLWYHVRALKARIRRHIPRSSKPHYR
jgi:hypothetical protein